MTWPRAALLSLSDKTGAADFARRLHAAGTRVLASGGTARHLEQEGIPVTAVEEWTGFEELLGGRVKTLHPHVHAPILARRGTPADLAALAERGLEPIDLVAVTLYPFERKARALDDAGAVEEIDIGGVALMRAAAKNHESVIIVHDPAQYAEVLAALERGATAEERRGWAIDAFARTARYDGAIAAELARRAATAATGEPAGPPPVHVEVLERLRGLRYGENPHQEAALYARAGERARLAAWKEGKELSYNNLVDLEAAAALAYRFESPACVIVKHGQPCGAACDATLERAWAAALHSDALSAYGGIVAFNRELDAATAERVAREYLECVAAPALDAGAEAALRAKSKLRIVTLAAEDLAPRDVWRAKPALRFVLLQRDGGEPVPPWRCVTSRAPDAHELEALRFAWEVAAAATSNAIAIARGSALIGLGSGQTSRVDAVDVALMKARRAEHPLGGAVLASDGFFPFPDNVEHAAAAGIRAIVQPGGSIRDAEVVEACDRLGVAMMFTDHRVFRH